MPLVGIAGIARADTFTVGTPSHPLANGLCIQPASNPPREVPCTSPATATPYVTTVTVGVADDPSHIARLADGSCVKDRIAVPRVVPCPTAAFRQANQPATSQPRPITTTTTMAPEPVVISTPADIQLAIILEALLTA
jgi:hypothetical protein